MGKQQNKKQTKMNYEYKKMTPAQAVEVTMRVNKEGKIPFVIDLTDSLTKFWNYKGHQMDIAGIIVRNAIEDIPEDPQEIGETMRRFYVSACKHGRPLIYNFGQNVPERLNQYMRRKPQCFNDEIIFDQSKNKEREYFQQIVKPNEDFNQYGDKELFPKEQMTITVLSECSRARLDEFLDRAIRIID